MQLSIYRYRRSVKVGWKGKLSWWTIWFKMHASDSRFGGDTNMKRVMGMLGNREGFETTSGLTSV